MIYLYALGHCLVASSNLSSAWSYVLLYWHFPLICVDTVLNSLLPQWFEGVQDLRQQSGSKPWRTLHHALQLMRDEILVLVCSAFFFFLQTQHCAFLPKCLPFFSFVHRTFSRSIVEHLVVFGQTWDVPQYIFFRQKCFPSWFPSINTIRIHFHTFLIVHTWTKTCRVFCRPSPVTCRFFFTFFRIACCALGMLFAGCLLRGRVATVLNFLQLYTFILWHPGL